MKCTTRKLLAGAAAVAGLAASSAAAEMPTGTPLKMRGLVLGITVEEFHQFAVPVDDPRYTDAQAWCTNDQRPKAISLFAQPHYKALGIVECKWFSRETDGTYFSDHNISIGSSTGSPAFNFIESNGQYRLFDIWFFGFGSQYAGIFDALSRGYGAPKQTVEAVKTKSGSEFTATTSVWDNGLSSITLEEMCGSIDRYCLTYSHTALTKAFKALEERQSAQAAEKI